MRGHDQHIINKQIFEFRCAEADHAFRLRQQMEDTVEQKIRSAINSVLDQWPVEATLQLGTLEIDLGEITFEELSDVLAPRFEMQFREKIQTALHARSPQPEISEPDHRRPENILEIFFLTGSLPWWCVPADNISILVLLEEWSQQNPDGMRAMLKRNLMSELFLRRFLFQNGATGWTILLNTLPAFASYWSALESRARASVDPAFIASSPTEFQTKLITVAIRLLKLPMDLLPWREIEIAKNIADVFDAASLTHPHKDPALQAFKGSEDDALWEIYQEAHAEAQRESHEPFEMEPPENSGEKFFIRNAGMVLMAAFLPPFFKELGWTHDGKFINVSAQHKALFMLHYLCTGDVDAPEYTLQLNKVLTGVPLQNPIPHEALLEAHERQEALQLLHDVKSHWTSLQNSSVEGLQGTFFLREGLLSFGNGRWLLQVDRKGCDVLLDSIPWSWQTIKLDWMETYLEVEW